ncbi:alpha/beta hydrolase [bacterium]|nr:alpha/beta hydrolase [candidate division CSSED10-310 bacterium]
MGTKLVWVFIVVSGIIGVIWLLVFHYSETIFFRPVKTDTIPSEWTDRYLFEPSPIQYREVTLDAFYLKQNESEHVVLIAHSGFGNLFQQRSLCEAFADLGVSVFIFDYRGYGRSSDTTINEASMTDDVLRAYGKLMQLGWPQDSVIFYGQDIGASLLAKIAQNKGFAAWIGENTVFRLSDVMNDIVRKGMVSSQFDVESDLINIAPKTFFIQNSQHPYLSSTAVASFVERYSSFDRYCLFTEAGIRSPVENHRESWKQCMKQFLEKVPPPVPKPIKKKRS